MSIYGTIWDIRVEVVIPVAESEEAYCKMERETGRVLSRAVFICTDKTTKGTARNGQEYVNPLMVFTGAEYNALNFDETMRRITEAVEALYESERS